MYVACREVRTHGGYRGFCSLGIIFQTMDNPYLREALCMPATLTGVLINRIQPTTATAQVGACVPLLVFGVGVVSHV